MADFEFSLGQIIIRQGDDSDLAYMILSGKIEVYREHADGSEQHLAFLDAGQIVGEYGILDSAPRSASVRAINHTLLRLIRIESEEE